MTSGFHRKNSVYVYMPMPVCHQMLHTPAWNSLNLMNAHWMWGLRITRKMPGGWEMGPKYGSHPEKEQD